MRTTLRRCGGHAFVAVATMAVVAAMSLMAGTVHAQETAKRKGFSIKITQPANQDFVLGKTKIAAEVKIDKPDAIEQVQFFVGDTLIFVDREPPYECFYDFGQQTRQLLIRAVAHHKEGVIVSDFIVTRQVAMSMTVKVNRVLLSASVHDKDGHFATGLGREDFTVFEEGKRKEITEFQKEIRPIQMAILMDVSGSMLEKLEEVHQAAGGFVETLRDEDRAMLVEFNEKVFMLTDITNDKEALKTLIESTQALGGTALYDALHVSLRRLDKFYDARKAIVLLTDGDDTQSSIDYKRLLEEVKSSDTTVYTIALGGGMFALDGQGRIKDLAETTGGRFYSPNKASELVSVYQQIADDLRNQYSIAYASDNEKFDGRWIPIKVEAKDKGKDLKVQHREGYFAIAREAP